MTTWTQILPPTEAEIEAFCEATNVVRPAPDAPDHEIRSFVSYLVEWLAERRDREAGPEGDEQ